MNRPSAPKGFLQIPTLWLVPETEGGIASYSRALAPAVIAALKARGCPTLEPIYFNWKSDRASVLQRVRTLTEKNGGLCIHIQHEFGLFGSKVTPFYGFGRWIDELRRAAGPTSRVLATAHTVLGTDYLYPVRGRGLQSGLRHLANRWWVPSMRRAWTGGTWGRLDGVIVHSERQLGTVQASGCPYARVIPHFIPDAKALWQQGPSALRPQTLVVFGYFSPEKGQELAIRALARLPSPIRLVLAGGVRVKQAEPYFEQCLALIESLGLKHRVEVTGFVPEERIDALYAGASLVIAPFTETSGSGSLAQALSRGAPILASDLSLNLEIAEREPGAIAYFKSEDESELAQSVTALLGDPEALQHLHEASLRYAKRFSVPETVRRHLDFYQGVGT